MENSKPVDNTEGPGRSIDRGIGQIGTSTYDINDFVTTWERVKRSISGSKVLVEIERWLLLNDSSALALDPVTPTYPPVEGRPVLVEIETKEFHKAGDPYTNTHMEPYYLADELEAAFTKLNATDPVESMEDVARFCAQITHLEKCYCGKVRERVSDEVLALELYRLLLCTGRRPTKG
jgi:hypothetical protein